MSATSLLLQGVRQAALEREQQAQLQIAEAEEAAEDAAAPAGATPAKAKKLSFGEYMSRSSGKPEKPETSNSEATMARVRGTTPVKPLAARLPSSPNFANDMKQLTAATATAVHQRTQLGSPSALRRSASSSKVQPGPGGDPLST